MRLMEFERPAGLSQADVNETGCRPPFRHCTSISKRARNFKSRCPD